MNKIVFTTFAFLSIVSLASFPLASHAADSMALTITPPFFELNLNPGDHWASSITVVNTNPVAIAVTGVLAGFSASDDKGHGQFTNLSALAGDPDALANWMTVPAAPVVIAPQSSGQIPFSISIPDTASPGGHYAAILVGTAPPSSPSGGSHIGVSSFISALIFVRVAGDVHESARISSFTTDKEYYEDPSVALALDFQNFGNVHLRPVGEIDIYNAWGKSRGVIPINQTGNLGYVLPSSTREFKVQWDGTPSLFDIGPYTAVATLAYGEDGSKSVSETISFWILPVWKLLEIALGTLFFVVVFVIAIRRYVRRALALEISRFGGTPPRPPSLTARSLGAPVREGVLDLRRAYEHAETQSGFDIVRYLRSVKKYALAGLFLIFIVLGIIWALLYIKEIAGGGGGFKATVDEGVPTSTGHF